MSRYERSQFRLTLINQAAGGAFIRLLDLSGRVFALAARNCLGANRV